MTNQIDRAVFSTYEKAFWEYNRLVWEKAYSGGDRDPWKQFQALTKKQFNLQITFARVVQPILIAILNQTQARSQKSIEQFRQILTNAKSFSTMLCEHQYIRKSQLKSIEACIEGHLKSPLLMMLQKAKRLGASRTQEEFQEEWEDAFQDQNIEAFWADAMGKRQDDKNLSILASIYHSCMKFKKIEALPEELQAILETKFENISGMNEKERSINQMLEGIAFRYSLENRAEMKMELEKEFDYICRTLEELFNMPIFEKLEIKVGKFGSLVNGFATDDADLDITICTNCYIKETFILEMVSGFLSKKLDIKNKTYDNPNYVSNASVPVVKITRNSPLTIKTDIIVNNVCGIINSRYLRVYSDMSKSVKYLGILLKLWAKKKGLIDQKMLSSYSFVLMMIYYLVKKGVVPNILRDVNTTDFQETAVNVKRFKNSNEEKFFIPTFFDFNLNTKKKFRFSLYEHLKGFAEYYGPGGEFWDTPTVISMLPTTRELEEDKIWTINDPFDTPHNPGRARLSDKSMFMNEFEDAFKKFESLEMTKIEALFT